jgi:AraC-like DNA-binding protein
MTFKLSFSSDLLPAEIPEARRFTAWADMQAENAGRGAPGVLEWTAHPAALFEARFELAALGDVAIARMTGTLSSARRTPGQIAADNNDQFVLAIPVSPGVVSIEQCGRETGNVSGSAVLVSMSEPGVARSVDPTNLWCNVSLPGAALRARAPMADDLLATLLPDPEGALKLLKAYSAMVLDGDEYRDPRLTALAAEHCMDLAVLALGARGDAAEAARLGGLRAVRLASILRRIRRNFRDPAFCVEDIAAGLGVSIRYVQVLLQESGIGFGERVLELRLDAALQLLVRDRPMRISEAAFSVGFSDLSYFNRCFRRRYGITPSGARGRGPG